MSDASLDAYQTIIPELPGREAAVLGLLVERLRNRQTGLTNKEIGHRLGLERDSISPRTSRLCQKGLLVESGQSGSETIYAAVLFPVVKMAQSKPKAYLRGVNDARAIVSCCIGEMVPESPIMKALERIFDRIGELAE